MGLGTHNNGRSIPRHFGKGASHVVGKEHTMCWAEYKDWAPATKRAGYRTNAPEGGFREPVAADPPDT